MRAWKVFSIGGLIVVSLGAGLAGSEAPVRIMAPMPVKAESGRFFQPHPLYEWTHSPDQRGPWAGIGSLPCEFKTEVQINRHGLRDREIFYEKPKGVRRILVRQSDYTRCPTALFGSRAIACSSWRSREACVYCG